MKAALPFLAILFLAVSCGDKAVKKPDNLIEEDKMVNIIYDLSLLEAAKSQKPAVLDSNAVDVRNYIYKKYKIDSIQFAKSGQYYASDIANYRKIYANVAKKLEDQKKTADSLATKAGVKTENPDEPQVK